MYKLKSNKLYFFSLLKLFFTNFKNYYYKSNYYNKKLVTFIPSRIFYAPSTYLSASLTTTSNDFYKIAQMMPDVLWNTNFKNELKFDNLHSFLWLSKLDRKNSKNITKDIVESWINNFFNYDPNTWKMETIAKRIISWTSNIDITLENSDKQYKEKFFTSLIKQSNFLAQNIKSLFNDSDKIICCAAIILSGILFKENNTNYKFGIKELEKIIKYYFDENGFPNSRNTEEVFVCIKYLILIREWFKEAQIPIPDFLNEIINKSGNCYAMLSSMSKEFPLFNGAKEINIKDYDSFLKNLNYKFSNLKHEISGFIKIKKKKLELFIDCGNPPLDEFSKNYQAGCLSFELFSNKKKIICNTGYGKYLSTKLTSLSRSTASHSTLYLNNTSSCIFQKNNTINKIYGNSLIEKHRITDKNYLENNESYSLSAGHNGYEKNLGYTHTRFIKVLKNRDKIFGHDKLKKTKKYLNSVLYAIRFHIYPNTKIVKTKGGNSILISLSNGEGWLLESNTNSFKIEKDIFLGNRNKIMNNECVLISGNSSEDITSIEWTIEKIA